MVKINAKEASPYEKDLLIQYFIKLHDEHCNQKYDNILPYSYHLKMVADVVEQFSNLLPIGNKTLALIAAYGHDSIEDARITYNDIKNLGGEQLADIIYACTEEKGKNRDERHSDKFYHELNQNPIATYVKLCDIVANVKHSLATNSSMYKKYKQEYEKTYNHLYRKEYADMFMYLNKLLSL